MKRRAIIIVTFIAGLYYLLEFLLPPRLGGSLDADGAESATRARHADGIYLAYTGLRRDRYPVILGVARSGKGPRRVLIAPSFARQDDYRGARAPQFVPPDRLYYIGLGWDDRTPRVCLARYAHGRWKPLPRAVLGNGRPGEPDSSGIGWTTVLVDGKSSQPWRMWYVGLQGDRGTVCYADSADGTHWTKRGTVAVPYLDGATAECVNAVATSEGVVLWLLTRDASDARRLRTVLVRPDGRTVAGVVTDPVAMDLPRNAALKDLRITRDGPGLTALATLMVEGGRPYLASMRAPVQFAATRLTLVEPSLLRPGAQPKSTVLSDVRGTVDDVLVVIGAFAVGLGLIGLAQVHGKRILALQRGWPESTAFFLAAFAMSGFTIYARLHPDSRTWGTRAYDLLFYGLLQPLGSSMFSLLAAYLVSAAYRAFRVRTFEGGLLAASATLIMLGQVPVGNWLTQHLPPYLQIPKVMAWVLFVNNTAVVRAVNFGIFVGALATALRVWLSMDRASMRSIE